MIRTSHHYSIGALSSAWCGGARTKERRCLEQIGSVSRLRICQRLYTPSLTHSLTHSWACIKNQLPSWTASKEEWKQTAPNVSSLPPGTEMLFFVQFATVHFTLAIFVCYTQTHTAHTHDCCTLTKATQLTLHWIYHGHIRQFLEK